MSEEIKSHHLRALAEEIKPRTLRALACDIEDCHEPQSWADYCRAAANRIESQAAEITRLRAELATARREGMEKAAKIARKYAERYRGKYIEIAVVCGTIADAISAAANEVK